MSKKEAPGFLKSVGIWLTDQVRSDPIVAKSRASRKIIEENMNEHNEVVRVMSLQSKLLMEANSVQAELRKHPGNSLLQYKLNALDLQIAENGARASKLIP